MTQFNKEKLEDDFVKDREYELPDFPNSLGFKFVYLQAVDPDFAENFVEDLKSHSQKREEEE